jgi:F0F1-type ATP synthase assembly protein I
MAFKMIAIILAGVFFGKWLDAKFGLETPIFTLILTLGSVSLAIYSFIRDSSK